jgi:hypothetical protein
MVQEWEMGLQVPIKMNFKHEWAVLYLLPAWLVQRDDRMLLTTTTQQSLRHSPFRIAHPIEIC